MVIDTGYFIKVLKKIAILFITLIGIYLSFKLAIFYTPFLIGFIISVLIEPIIKKICKKTQWARKIVATIVLICLFTILISLISIALINLISESSNLLQSLNIYVEKIYNKIQKYIFNIDFDKIEMPKQVISLITNSTNNLLDYISKWVGNLLTLILQSISLLPIIGVYIVITILSTYFICTDKFYILDQLEHHFPRNWVNKFIVHLKKLISTIGGYLKAETTLIFISFFIVFIGLCIFKWCGLNINFPFLAALGIAFVDALPVLRLWNCNGTLGNNFGCEWRFTTGYRNISFICSYNDYTPISRA